MQLQLHGILNDCLPEEDIQLFESMDGKYISHEEQVFFETLCEKEMDQWTTEGDDILDQNSNEEKIFLVRMCFNEYQFGKVFKRIHPDIPNVKGFYTNSLYEALHINLKDIGEDKDMTFWQWLRQRNYEGVRYDHNRDDL